MDRRVGLGDRGTTIVAIAGTVLAVLAMVSMLARGRPLTISYELFLFHNAPSAIVLLWMGRLVLRQQPGNAAGAVLMVIGLADALHAASAALFDARLMAAGIDVATEPDFAPIPAELPIDAAVPLLFVATLWVPAAALALTLLVLLFPDGRLPGPRWRWVREAALAGTFILAAAFTLDAWPTADWAEGEGPALVEAAALAGLLLIAGAAVASIAALLSKWRQADGLQRLQFRTVGIPLLVMVGVTTVTYPWQLVWIPVTLIAFNVVVIAYALAVARYRLHDLEPVLGRTAVAAVLAGLVGAVYLLIVVGIGALVGRGLDSTWLPLLAVAVVALLIEPARRRVRRWVDRWLYGRDTDRAEVLSRVAERASATVAPEAILEEVAQLLVRSTGANRAEVWLEVAPQPQLAAAAGEVAASGVAIATDVVHDRERLGEIRLHTWTATDLVPDAQRVVDDVAHSLGVVLRNVRLTAQLRAQLEELRESRQRLVEVHDTARRELERDIHDGAQARLIGLRLRLGLTRAYADAGDAHAVTEQLELLASDAESAIRSLRELARGLHPPILQQAGVAAALRAHVRSLPTPVTISADDVGRYPQALEGAVYFACLEAVQNAVRHGDAEAVHVELSGGEQLTFCVHDDGRGFDTDASTPGAGLTNITDRITALGGHVDIDSRPGHGVRISGSVPTVSSPRG